MKTLKQKSIFLTSLLSTIFFTLIIFFYVEPQIKGASQFGLINLEFSFTKESVLEIVSIWGSRGVNSFNQLIFLDFIYPVCYSLLFSSLIVKSYVEVKLFLKLRFV